MRKFFSDLRAFMMRGNIMDMAVGIAVGGAFTTLLVRYIGEFEHVLNRQKAAAAPTTKSCPRCCSTIPVAATRCPNCTSELGTS